MYKLEWQIVFALLTLLFSCLLPKLQSMEGNKPQNFPQVNTKAVYHDNTYNIIFLTRHNQPINDNLKTISTHSLCVSLALSMFWWWVTSQSVVQCIMGHGNHDMSSWKVTSDSLGHMNFIYGDIYGRSCKVPYIETEALKINTTWCIICFMSNKAFFLSWNMVLIT